MCYLQDRALKIDLSLERFLGLMQFNSSSIIQLTFNF